MQTVQIPLNKAPGAALGSLLPGCDRAIHVFARNHGIPGALVVTSIVPQHQEEV